MRDLILEFESDFLFEASPYRSEILKDIDQDFVELKKDVKNQKVIKSLIEHVKEFTNIKNINISVKEDYNNTFVVPIYNQQLSLDVIDLFKDFAAGKNLRKLETVEEVSKYIKKIYIVFGDKSINLFTPRELTAILLHELGHCFIHTANMPTMIIGLLRKIVITVELIPKIILIPLISISLVQLFIITATLFIICRSLTFLEHRSEYKADQFASKYGYGDEIIKVLYKLHNIQEEVQSKYSWIKKVLHFIMEFFIPKTHPKETQRILKASEEIIVDYKKMYPKVSKELNIILSDIKGEA